MPIEIYTGKPGNGKTALMVERLLSESKKGERPLFAAGIEELEPGLATVLDDPRRWNEKDADGNHLVPDGSLIFVDEAWKWFGHLHDASRQATPPHVLALAEHRHRGLDFIWTSQGPNQIYPFARPLIADHYHVVRQFGTSIIDVYHWQELQEEVKSQPRRESADRTTKTLPSVSFGKYKSASEHTIKRRIPWKVYALPVLLVALVALVWLSIELLKPSRMAAHAAEGPEAAQADPGLTVGTAPAGTARAPLTTADYIAVHMPRVPAQPWTAPVFDGRDAQSQPELYCMSTDTSCSCLTEQGTRYIINPTQCRYMARWGPSYNAYKAPRQEQQQPPEELQREDVAASEPDLGRTIEGDPAKVNGAGVVM